jgi:hypothetical protein
MAYASPCRDAHLAAAPRKGLLRRFYEAVMDSRRQHAERDIARLLGRSGGRLTDDIERQITERISTGDWSRRN